jgi:RNA polymerase sigma-70 factor, ECF subfamily
MTKGRASLQIVPRAPAEEAAGDVLDAEWLFRRYSPYVAAVAHRLLGRDEDVDDTVQEVFVAALRGMGQLREPAAVKGWLAQVTVRTARRRLRVRRLFAFFGADERPTYEHVVDAGASPEQRALLARIYRSLDGLPADHRLAWVLRHVQGERLDDVATLCGCSLATAKRRIGAAEQALSKELSDG